MIAYQPHLCINANLKYGINFSYPDQQKERIKKQNNPPNLQKIKLRQYLQMTRGYTDGGMHTRLTEV